MTYENIPGWSAVEAAGRVENADLAVFAAARQRLPFDVTTTGGTSVSVLPRRRGWPRARLALAGLAAVAVAGVAVAIPDVGGDGTASAAAVDVLDRAVLAANVPGVEPQPGQYWRVESTAVNLFGDQQEDGTFEMFLEEQNRITWIPRDSSQPTWWDATFRIADVVDADMTLDEARKTYPESREAMQTAGGGKAFWQVPTWDWLQTLPRDPESLRDRLYADSAGQGQSVDGEAVVFVADMLRSGIVPVDLRVALYEVLKTVPGVEVTAADADITGRSGVALGRLEIADGQQQEIVIDPVTGDYLGERYVYEDGTVTEGAVMTTIVDAVPRDVQERAIAANCGVPVVAEEPVSTNC